MGLRTFVKDALGLAPDEQRFSFNDWLSYMTFDGLRYPLGGGAQITGTTEPIGAGFSSYVAGAYQANGIVFACIAARMLLFSEARFAFQNFKDHRPGDLYGNQALSILRHPWDGGTMGDLLSMMELDVSLGGNAFVHRRGSRLVRLRPDWVTVVLGTRDKDATMWDLDAEVLGYVYQEGGPGSNREPVGLQPNVVAHYMPYPDPLAPRRGMSWLTPVIREIQADSSYTAHKSQFIDNQATPNVVLEYDPATTLELYNAAKQAFTEGNEGARNAGKTLHLLGASAKTIGANFQQMDFKSVQGAGETRIAAAAGIHPVIVGLSEGLQGSSLNTGNFAAARRLTADKTLRPLWRNAAGSLSQVISVPSDSELVVDTRDIAFLREDSKDAAEIQSIQALTIKALGDGGYTSESVIAAVEADDWTKLKHSGLYSVQLQPPGTTTTPAPAVPADPTTNGHLDAPPKVAP